MYFFPSLKKVPKRSLKFVFKRGPSRAALRDVLEAYIIRCRPLQMGPRVGYDEPALFVSNAAYAMILNRSIN